MMASSSTRLLADQLHSQRRPLMTLVFNMMRAKKCVSHCIQGHHIRHYHKRDRPTPMMRLLAWNANHRSCSSFLHHYYTEKNYRHILCDTERQRWRQEKIIHSYAGGCHSFSSRPRSPYAVLKLRTSASKNEIKAAFRKLAKVYHPDVNLLQNRLDCEAKMAELVEAYDQLLDDDFGGRVGDSRVALACELYTIEELRMDRLHDVYSIRLLYPNNDNDNNDAISLATAMATSIEVNTEPVVEVMAHPDDSISDLKRKLQSRFESEWGLTNRRKDRDQIATGWELVSATAPATNDEHGSSSSSLLSYHLFLHSYNLANKDVIHAVVRRYSTTE